MKLAGNRREFPLYREDSKIAAKPRVCRKMDSSINLQESWSSDKEIYVSTYEELFKVISEYETDTISKFIIRRVDKEFGSKGQYPINIQYF